MNHLGELLSAYIDGEVDSVELDRVESHLAGCDACSHELAALMGSRNAVRSLPLLELPPHLTVPAGEVVVPLRRRQIRRRVAAAVAAAAVAAAVYVGVPGPGSSTDVPLNVESVVDQHVARTSLDPGLQVVQVSTAIGTR